MLAAAALCAHCTAPPITPRQASHSNAGAYEAALTATETGFVAAWYDGSLQDVIFFPRQQDKIRRMICSVLAGYAWDRGNPYTGPQAHRRLRALAEICRTT